MPDSLTRQTGLLRMPARTLAQPPGGWERRISSLTAVSLSPAVPMDVTPGWPRSMLQPGGGGVCWFVDSNTVTLLPDGKALIAGSADSDFGEYDVLADAEVYE